MKPVKKQIVDVSDDYRKSTIAYFNRYKDWLHCIDNLKPPYNVNTTPYKLSYPTPGSIEERIYMKLYGILWETNR